MLWLCSCLAHSARSYSTSNLRVSVSFSGRDAVVATQNEQIRSKGGVHDKR